MKTIYKWLVFEEITEKRPHDSNCRAWCVKNKKPGSILGVVVWYNPWREYCFEPEGWNETIFSPTCLRDIASFCSERTSEKEGGTG
jgi:hypothetical protein